jgi:hypothetical protein
MARLATLLIPALLLAAVPAAAQTEGPRSGERADIPFATNGGIRTFTPSHDGEGVYLQDRSRNWYYARFYTRCHELPFAFYVGYRTFGGSSTLSRGDTILAGRDRCRIADIVHSGPPPKKVKKPKAAKAS